MFRGGFDPGFRRTIPPGNPSTLPQIIPSAPIAKTVERGIDARILGRIGGSVERGGRAQAFAAGRRCHALFRLHVGVALAVAVGIENQSRPALRLLRVVRFIPHLGVEPAHHSAAAAAAGPQCVVGVLGEQQVVRAETGVDHRGLFRRRIVHGQLPARPIERRERCRRKARPCLAERRIIGRRGSGWCTTDARADRTSDCGPWYGYPRSPRHPRLATLRAASAGLACWRRDRELSLARSCCARDRAREDNRGFLPAIRRSGRWR